MGHCWLELTRDNDCGSQYSGCGGCSNRTAWSMVDTVAKLPKTNTNEVPHTSEPPSLKSESQTLVSFSAVPIH
jgi:hypothetical protein